MKIYSVFDGTDFVVGDECVVNEAYGYKRMNRNPQFLRNTICC